MQKVIHNNRLSYFDALRGLAMFLVVMGHVMQFSFDLGGYKTFLSHIIVSVHLPIFFFVSGFFIYKKQLSKTTIALNMKTKAIILLIPATIFFCIYTYMKCGNPLSSFIKYGFDAYWFTFVLFEMCCVYYMILLVVKDNKMTDLLMIAFSLFGVFALMKFNRDGLIWKYLIIENFFKYFQFFSLGVLFHKYFDRISKIIRTETFKMFVLIAFLISLLVSFNDSLKDYSDFLFSLFHDEIMRYLGVILLYLYFDSKKHCFEGGLSKTARFLSILGRRTLDVYFIHYFLLPDLGLFTPYISDNKMFLVQLLISLFLSIIIIGICFLLSNIIRMSNRCAYILLGVKLKE